MVNFVVLVLAFAVSVSGVPVRLREELSSMNEERNKTLSMLQLPSNATSIRADITDNFSCESKMYGYFADVDNECQIFHVCLPVTYADGKERTFRWSFICPEDTVFSQEIFTCVRTEDLGIECTDSEKYYNLNDNFGMIDKMNDSMESTTHADVMPSAPERFLEKKTNLLFEPLQSTPSPPVESMPATTTFKYEYNDAVEPEEENYLNEPIPEIQTVIKELPAHVDPSEINEFFPSYFVNESFDEKMPDIFMELKKNMENSEKIVPENTNIESLPNELKTQPIDNENIENSKETNYHEIKRRFLFKADARN